MIHKPLRPIVLFTLSLFAAQAPAEAVNESQTLLCATVDTVECVAHGDCTFGSADTLGFPQFLHIDLTNKAVSATRPDGTTLNAALESVTEIEDRLVLQGVQNRLGWSVSISRTSGHMTVAIAGKDISFVVFGACTAR